MISLKRLLSGMATAAALGTATLCLTAGVANAAAPTGLPTSPSATAIGLSEPIVIGGPPGHREHNSTTTSVHNSGSGSTAVTAAGGPTGNASQYADQTKPDTSTHSRYVDSSRRVNRTVSNSHNSSVYRDSHNTKEVGRY